MVLAYLAPYGVGLGHASRMVLLADRLKSDGIGARFSTFGEAASYVEMRGYPCARVPPVEFSWSIEGGFSVSHSISQIPKWFSNFARQISAESRNISACAPSVVLSDSRLSPIFAARLLSVPSVVILNQIKLLLSPRLRQLAVARLFENIVAEFLGTAWSAADRILVPDLPPPYTISEDNLWSVNSAKLEYIGFTSPRPSVSNEAANRAASRLGFDLSRPVVFGHISGPAQTRIPMLKKIVEALKDLDGVQSVISEGKPGGDTEPRKIAGQCWYYEWCPIRDEIFSISDAVILRGGHAALSQALQFGKPVVTIPIENHGEQLGNSAKLQAMGAGVMLNPKGLTPKSIRDSVLNVLGDSNYAQNAKRLMELSAKFDGIEFLERLVKSHAGQSAIPATR